MSFDAFDVMSLERAYNCTINAPDAAGNPVGTSRHVTVEPDRDGYQEVTVTEISPPLAPRTPLPYGAGIISRNPEGEITGVRATYDNAYHARQLLELVVTEQKKTVAKLGSAAVTT